MATPMLPAGVQAEVDRRLAGVSRTALADAAERLSRRYRDGRASAEAVHGDMALLAYLVTRLPATYAAATRVLGEVARRAPQFAPASLLDLGAGCGAATLAAQAVWPSLERFDLVDGHAGLRAAAEGLTAAAGLDPQAVHIAAGDLRRLPANGGAADVVTLSYVLAELSDTEIAGVLAAARARTAGCLVIVEPGTPAGFARIRQARDVLRASGLHILAPCPHGAPCPMVEPDWCHFSVRLPRSRDHRLAKRADAPFEDEKFSYVAAATDALAGEPAAARVLSPPLVTKADATLRLCTERGIAVRRIPHRDKTGYKTARKLSWGDATDAPDDMERPTR